MAKIYKYIIFFIVITLFQSGCLKNTLIYHTKNFEPHAIDVITVLPVLDARRQVYASVDFEKETKKIQKLIVKRLKKKNYTLKVIGDTNAMGNIQPTQIPFLDADRISKIGPNDSNWILVPVVTALKNFMGANTKHAEIVCYLFEKRTGKLVWEGSGYYPELRGATKNVMRNFPSNK